MSAKRPNSICQHCGKSYHPKRAGRITYCSRECYFESGKVGKTKQIREKKTWHCNVCHAQMDKYRVYCSKECEKQKERLRSFAINSAKKELRARPCKECGNLFMPEYGNKHRGFCTNECAIRYHRRTAKATRRARQRGNERESFSPYAVFDRDHWSCQLCRIRTPRKLRGTHDDHAPELDHIIPLADGGEHSMRNTQCLCRKCNQDKGATTKGQLRMFA